MDTTRIAVTGGVRLNVHLWPDASSATDDLGSLAPFLLVHGLASNARLWDGVAEALAAAGAVVAAVDQRGHGRSDKVDEGYDFATVSADLAAVVDWLGWDCPVAVGQSWGGNVVLELAARYPARTRGIGCVDGGWIDLSVFPTFEECERVLAPPAMVGLPVAELEGMFRTGHPDWPEAGIQGALACFEQRENGTVAPWLTYDRHISILRRLWEQRPTAVYPRVGVPALLMPCDDGSGRVERKRQEVAAAEAGLAKFLTHWFTADHDVHAQHPGAVADVLLDAVKNGFFR